MAQTPTRPSQRVRAPAYTPKIHSTSHLVKKRVSVLYQGPPGTGKTYNMATWPNPFFFVWDKNLATLENFPGIPWVSVQSWDEMERLWLPAIKERRITELVQGFKIPPEGDGEQPYQDYTVETLCFDSLTFLVNQNVLELGDGGARGLGYDGWDAYYARIHKLITTATEATTPSNVDPSLESYNVCMSVHEDAKSNEQGVVTQVVPSVQGKMNSHLAAFFSCHLLTDVRQKPRPKKDEPPTREWFVRTMDDGYRKCKGDTIGGGKLSRLPETLPGTYPSLATAWGLEKKED